MAAPKTVKTYPLDGSGRDFEIPFEYLARKFVVVTLIGTDRRVLVLNIDYRFTQRTIITLTRNWGPAEGYSLIEIKRVTSATERLVDFSDGSILRAADLNTATVQALHIAEEGRDIATDTIGVDNNGQLDARGRQIKNLADAVLPGDAVTLRQEQEWAASTLSNRNGSEAARAGSEAARDAAVLARTQSEASRDTTNTYKSQAQSAASASESSSQLSQRWAENPVDSQVAPGKFSALHHAAKAIAGASEATAQAGIAATQAGIATTQAGLSATARAGSEAARDTAQTYATQVQYGTVPLFSVQWWGGKRSQIPGGYIPGDGQLISRAVYTDVAANVSTLMGTVAESLWLNNPAFRGNWATGDGSTTLRVPDLNGQSAGAIGAPFLRGDGALSSAVAGVIRDSQNKAHSHSLNDPGHSHGVSDPGHSHITTLFVGPNGAHFDPGIINTQVGQNSGPVHRETDGRYTGISINGNYTGITMNSQGGADAHPIEVTGCWIIKVYGAVVNSGALDASKLASDLSALGAAAVLKTGDSGWIDLPLAPGMRWIGDPWVKPQYRRRPDGTVMVRGLLAGAPPAGTYFATLPAGFRPTHNIRCVGINSATPYYYDIVAATGQIVGYGYQSPGANISFECSFTTD